MTTTADKPRLAAGLTGAALAAQLVLLRVVSAANESSVTLAGRELHWGCAFKQAFGIPCPNCGMTRSVVLALHGDLGRAFEINPAGPLLVMGGLLLSAVLLFAAFRRNGAGEDGKSAGGSFMSRVMLGTAAYGGLVFAVLLVNWVRVLR